MDTNKNLPTLVIVKSPLPHLLFLHIIVSSKVYI